MNAESDQTRRESTKHVRRKIRRKKLPKEEKDRRRRDRAFRTQINTVFTNAQFTQVATRGEQIEITGRQGEIDSVFLYENLVVLVEDTTAATENIKEHLLKSASFFTHIANNTSETLRVLDSKFQKFKSCRKAAQYTDSDYRWIFLYSPLNALDIKYEKRHPELVFLRHSHLQYFLSLSKTIGGSVRFELFQFLRLKMADIGIEKQGQDKREYTAVVLPESPSGFPGGHKIVSFLIEPSTLLEQVYVLRKDGWQDGDCLYQRLLMKSKIAKMREYLASEKRVFVNNIIATLPDDTRFLDKDGNQVSGKDLSSMQTIKLELRRQLGSIGLVDGQHRVFAYHEGLDRADKVIELLREKQHLLVTAIVYPADSDPLNRTRFEAKLFLEINDKQTRTKGNLKQTIQTIIEPFSDVAIAKCILGRLSVSGPLCGYLEEYFYDRGKIKTTSIVSYGLKHIVGIDAQDSLFRVWSKPGKNKLSKSKNRPLLNDYLDFCTQQVSAFISGFRQNISKEMWTLDKRASRVLTTTTINGLIFCLRRLIQEKKTGEFHSYKKSFEKLNIDFRASKFSYRSSHWRELGNTIYEQCFA